MTPEELKKIRLALALSQEAFAHLIGVSFQTINRWENGAFKPSRLAIEKIKSLTNKMEKKR